MTGFLHAFNRFLVIYFLLLVFLVSGNLAYAQRASLMENISEANGLPSNYIFSITQDHNGFTWLGSDKGLIKYASGQFTVFDTDFGLPGNYINSIVADNKRGILMYLSEKGLYYFDIEKQKITVTYKNFGPKVPAATITKSKYYPDYFLFSVYGGRSIYAIHRDELRKVHRLHIKPDPLVSGQTNYVLQKGGRTLILAKSIDIEFDKTIISGNKSYKIDYGNGILRYINGKLQDTITESKGLSSNLISGYMKKKNGDLYFGTFGGGISILKAKNNRVSFDFQELKARAVSKQGSKYYILSEGFLHILDNKELIAKSFLKRDALTMLVDQEDFYLGSFSGLDHYKIRNNTLHHVNHFQHGSGVSKIIKHNGKLVFSTYGTGVFVQEGSTFRNILNPAFNNIEDLFKNHDGTFVVTSYDSGFSILDKNFNFVKNYSKEDGLISSNIGFTYGEKDTLWVGSKRGISALVNGKIVANFTEKDGFIGSAVRIIFRSAQNELWLVTDKMILKKSGEKLKPLGSLNILGDNDNVINKSIYWKNLNELAITTGNKLSIINLADIKPDETPERPALEKVFVDSKEVEAAKVIKIGADNFRTVLQFSPVDKNLLQKNRYFFRMKGGRWQHFTHPESLVFDHLDYGNYEVEVKTLNSDGYESFYPGKLLIKVQPHFYLRWWFLIGMLLLILAISALIWYSYYKNKYAERLQQIQLMERLETERKRISRDLHDNMGAYTTSLIYKLDDLRTKMTDDADIKKVDAIRENATFIMSLLRQTIWILSSKETKMEAFGDALISYTRKVLGPEPKIKIYFIDEIENDRILDSSESMALFRILQEAFHNVIKHAEATEVKITVKSDGKVSFAIADNGKGFELKEYAGNGLRNMRERAEEVGFDFKIVTGSSGTEIRLNEK